MEDERRVIMEDDKQASERVDCLAGLDEPGDPAWNDYHHQEEAVCITTGGETVEEDQTRDKTVERERVSNEQERVSNERNGHHYATHPPAPVSAGRASNATSAVIHRARKIDERVQSMEGVFVGDELKLAKDSKLAKLMWDDEQLNKPRWAVRPLVMIRDAGKCRVCAEFDQAGDVEQIVPVKDGGMFEERNCIYLCRACLKCWPKYEVSRFLGHETKQEDWELISLFVFKRRLKSYKGTRPLLPEGIALWNRYHRNESTRKLERTINHNPHLKQHVLKKLDEIRQEHGQKKTDLPPIYDDSPAYNYLTPIWNKIKRRNKQQSEQQHTESAETTHD